MSFSGVIHVRKCPRRKSELRSMSKVTLAPETPVPLLGVHSALKSQDSSEKTIQKTSNFTFQFPIWCPQFCGLGPASSWIDLHLMLSIQVLYHCILLSPLILRKTMRKFFAHILNSSCSLNRMWIWDPVASFPGRQGLKPFTTRQACGYFLISWDKVIF